MTNSPTYIEPLVTLRYAGSFRLADPLPGVVVAACADAGVYCIHLKGAFHALWQFQYVVTAIMESVALSVTDTSISACMNPSLN
jgi:hypothetical protein